ncbi:MAG: DUF4329 domain-containing protein [Deltaproteobacteria bacterium]|nr:DUF4329 domain-containing protein [Deltaproteobacteria bacterium]
MVTTLAADWFVTTAGSSTTSYAINGLGQRVSKSSASATTIFVYDEAGHLLGEYDSAGSVIEETVWLGSLPVGVLKPGALYYVNPDHLGAPRSIIDTTGATVWKWDKDPFGNGAPTGTLIYNLRFPGQYFDVESGLCYNMARDYSPTLGRYVQSDPIGLRGGVNTYSYVGNGPINWRDTSGLLPGDQYPTVFEAGANAIEDINSTSISENREYGGWIYINPNGTFSYTSPYLGDPATTDLGPEPCEKAVGDYHTHGAYDPHYNNEVFSVPEDTGDYFGAYRYGFLGTPNGAIRLYDSHTLHWRTLYGPRLPR